jgi:hypothetical protein
MVRAAGILVDLLEEIASQNEEALDGDDVG